MAKYLKNQKTLNLKSKVVPMKILQICPLFPPSPANTGSGVTHVVYNVSKELVKKGHEVSVYTSAVLDDFKTKMDHFKNPTNVDGIEVYYFPEIMHYRIFYLTPKIIPCIKRSLKNFDVIHMHDVRSFQSIICHYYAKKYGVPYVLQLHGSALGTIRENKLKWIIDTGFSSRIVKDSDKMIAITKTESDYYKNIGISDEKIEIVPNGIDLSKYTTLPKRGEFRRRYRIENDEKIILYLGRLNKTKGIDFLVEAFVDLLKQIENSRLVIAGPDDGFLAALKKQVQDFGVNDTVLFTGSLHREDKLRAYVDADVYVLPSPYEPFGLTLLEAGACGVPVIASNRCGIANLIKQFGYVVECDSNKIRDALLKLLNDDELRARLGEIGKDFIKNEFGQDKSIDKLERIYEGVKVNAIIEES